MLSCLMNCHVCNSTIGVPVNILPVGGALFVINPYESFLCVENGVQIS